MNSCCAALSLSAAWPVTQACEFDVGAVDCKCIQQAAATAKSSERGGESKEGRANLKTGARSGSEKQVVGLCSGGTPTVPRLRLRSGSHHFNLVSVKITCLITRGSYLRQ
jgi:hypothetical protein